MLVHKTHPRIAFRGAMDTLEAGTAAALGIVEPMAATLLSVLILDEQISLYSCFGVLLILFAVLLLSRADERKQYKTKKRSNGEAVSRVRRDHNP